MTTAHERPSRLQRVNALISAVLVGSSEQSRAQAVIVGLVTDLTAPVILSVLALHELLYNQPPWPIWVLVTVLTWVLVWRRRWPLIVFGVTLGIVLGLSVAGVDSAADAALLIALYSVAAHSAFRYALVCGVILEVGVFFVARRFAPAGSIDDAVVLLTGLAAAVLFLGTTLRSRRGYLASVEDRARRLELERLQQAQLAALAERARIAREMHDIVGHGLSVVITLAEGAAAVAEAEPARAKAAMQQVAAGGRQSLAELRKLFGVLRSENFPALSPQPGLATLDELIGYVQTTGLRVAVDRTGGELDVLSDAAQATLYRIIQESLTNVIKHATGATDVRVTLDYVGNQVDFSIRDNGRAHATEETGTGILGMRERVALFDGEIATSQDSSGWTVSGFLRLAA